MPASRSCACSSSVRPTAVAIDPEHLLDDLTYSRERVELPSGDLVQQAAQLGVLRYGLLQVDLRPRGGDGEDLARQVLAPPRLELARLLEVRAVLAHLRPELRDVLPALRLGQHDRHLPRALAVEREHRPHLAEHGLR